MAFWWVNHNDSFRREIANEALWAPIRSRRGILAGHSSMALVEPDDVIVSYSDTKVSYVGRAADRASFCVMPRYYRNKDRWNRAGRLLPVKWTPAVTPFRPIDHAAIVAPLLPGEHSPLKPNGHGNMTYLSAISPAFGSLILEHLGLTEDALPTARGTADSHTMAAEVEADWAEIILGEADETERQRLVNSRTKQGLYKSNLKKIEPTCRVTGISDPTLLIASHAKPWAVCDNAERVSAYNGLMLAPQVDYLFDRGLLQFHNDGTWSFSPKLTDDVISRLGLPLACDDPQPFKEQQRPFIQFHREFRFKG